MDIKTITKLADGSMQVAYENGEVSIINKTDELFQVFTVFYILNKTWTK